MACNCNSGKTYNIGMGCCVPVVANANNYYTKSEVDEKIDEIVISGGGITSGEVQTMIDNSIPTSNSAFTNDEGYITSDALNGYATEQWVENQHYITGVDLSDYALKSDIPTSNSAFTNDEGYITSDALNGYATEQWTSGYTYDKATIDEKVAGGGTFDPTQYYTTGQTDSLLNKKLDASAYTPTDLSQYWTSAQTESAITSATNDMATQTWVGNQHYITGVDLSDYALKSEIPTVPTSNTAFTNDAGYITSGYVDSAISGKADTSAVTNVNDGLTAHTADTSIHFTTGAVQTLIDNSISGKQDTLIAGNGISIDSTNTISVTGGTSGSGVTSGEVQTMIDQSISGKADTSAITSSVTSASTDSQIPTAKAVFDAIPTGGTSGSYSSGRGIDITNNTISVSLSISAGTGTNSIIEGNSTIASGNSSHAEGIGTKANGDSSHAEGNSTTAKGNSSHAEGYITYANGNYSHAESDSTKAYGESSHAEGKGSVASGYSSHAEGYNTTASGYSSHAEGTNTKAYGGYSHAEGNNTIASGESSHAEGKFTVALNDSEHASGQYNVSSSGSSTFGYSGNTLFSVGNGTANNARHNAFEIRQNGDIYITSGGTDIKLQDNLGGGGGGGVTSGEVQTMIDNSISGKADTSAVTNVNDGLTAHTTDTSIHVTTSDKNTWSGKQDALTAGNNIRISANTISTIVQFWCGTQLEYDAISGQTDSNTIYMIHE